MAESSDKIAYKRNKYYNPKVHVDGWFDIQKDTEYIEKYNNLKQIHLEYYPNLPINEKHKSNSLANLKNKSVKEVIFYQNVGPKSWVTENQAAFTYNYKQSFYD